MMRSKALHVLGGALVLLLVGCGLLRPHEVLRYRLIVDVDTPQGLRTGSSVIEVRGVKNPDWLTPEGRGTRASFRGEAVAVDLPNHRTLFALLQTGSGLSDAAAYPYFAFKARLTSSRDWVSTMRMLKAWVGQRSTISGTEELRSDGIQQVPVTPLLVTFDNLHDPRSVRRVEARDFPSVFGPGIRLRDIAVEITDAPVTSGLVDRLPWLPTVNTSLRGTDFDPVGLPVGDYKHLFISEWRS